jgi:aspartate/methionine/tyrosine aminotransferase
MTGWRISWLVVPDEFIEATEKLAQKFTLLLPRYRNMPR